MRDDLAIVSTVDLITPLVDDPYLFGQVAAANSVSDVFAMGGEPICALNVCCFPKDVPPAVLAEILRGGRDKMREAGAAIVGGHTVRDDELKYGCAVTGTVHPDRIVRNVGARAGDVLILTKPIGTGVLIGGYKKGLLSAESMVAASRMMAELNAVPGRLMSEHGVHAGTDITGFGLIGHGFEMARGSDGVGLRLRMDAIPVMPESVTMIRAGVKTAMTAGNRASVGDALTLPDGLELERATVLWDPQTSGGMLMAVPADRADGFIERLRAEGVEAAVAIGEVFASKTPVIEVVDS